MNNKETSERVLEELRALETTGIKIDLESGHGKLIREIADFVGSQPAAEAITRDKESFIKALNYSLTITRIENVFANVGITFAGDKGVGRAFAELKSALSDIQIAFLGLHRADDGMWYPEDNDPDFAADEYVVSDLCCNPETYNVTAEEVWGCFGEQNPEMKDEIVWKSGYEIGL